MIKVRAAFSLASASGFSLTTKEPYQPCLRDLRYWYTWARETGRHEKYLKRIETLAVDFKLKTLGAESKVDLSNPNTYLPEVDLFNMMLDQSNYQEILRHLK